MKLGETRSDTETAAHRVIHRGEFNVCHDGTRRCEWLGYGSEGQPSPPMNDNQRWEEAMNLSKKLYLTVCATTASLAMAAASSAGADELSMWVRASAANAAPHLIDLWNSGHADKIKLAVIPDNQMVTKLATGVQAGEVPDLISFDLIYMPDFMRAGFLIDITDQMKADPNAAKVATAFTDLATYQGKEYGTGFTPDVSDAHLQQGSLQEGRARSRQAADLDRSDS